MRWERTALFGHGANGQRRRPPNSEFFSLFYHSLALYNCPLVLGWFWMITSPTDLRPDNRLQNHVNPTVPTPLLLPISNTFSTASYDPIYQSHSEIGGIVSPTWTVS